MGCVQTIDFEKFPKQSSHLGKRAKVIFHYNTETVLFGQVVRDDIEAPFLTIIRLDDGRHVLPTECQYQPVLK